MSPHQFSTLLRKALQWRFEREPRLQNSSEIGRCFAGDADGLAGVLVDAFGPLVVLTIYNPEFVSRASELMTALKGCVQKNQHVLVKVRAPQGGFEYLDPEGVLGNTFIATEDDCLFEVRADEKNDFGLFPDARPARLILRDFVKPQSRILNLFSYTCGFAVVACRAGAQLAINVDASPEMLTWGKRNAELNKVDFAVIPEMAQKYLLRLERRVIQGTMECPDIWVCDPPAFGVGRGPQRVLKHFWEQFWQSVKVLRPMHVLVLRNDRTGFRSTDTLLQDVHENVGDLYRAEPISFARSPSLCYDSNDAFYKLTESLVLSRR